MIRRFLVLAAIGVAIYIGGFLHFTRQLTASIATDTITGDGIIVLTGAPDRIAVGLDLLKHGRGERLLITGVFEATTREDIIAVVNGDAELFSCCVDIDREALDTIGNAVQARIWSEQNDFQRLVVVTSSYHMPRSIMEFERAMQGYDLVAYPVPVSGDHVWWRNPQAGRVYFSEYAKYVFALVRNRVNDTG